MKIYLTYYTTKDNTKTYYVSFYEIKWRNLAALTASPSHMHGRAVSPPLTQKGGKKHE
ncbi:MAG: hypothetical protein GX817_01060 [Elusimicrobia bacterium]|nr:hypothetical protein [Elusimicrobiota bacterium]